MPNCLAAPLFTLLSVVCASCALTPSRPDANESLSPQGASVHRVSMHRVRVYRGPIAYVARSNCRTPTRVVVPRIDGITAMAFLGNHAPLTACGRERSSVVVPAGAELDPFVIGQVRTANGFFVACVVGDSRPKEVVIDLTCRD